MSGTPSANSTRLTPVGPANVYNNESGTSNNVLYVDAKVFKHHRN